MAEKSLTRETVDSLSQKLDEFAEVLTEDERAVLLGLLGTAAATIAGGQQNVESEGGTTSVSPRIEVGGRAATLPPSLALRDAFARLPQRGLPGSGGGVVSDSVGVGVGSISWSKDLAREVDAIGRPGGMNIPGLRTIR